MNERWEAGCPNAAQLTAELEKRRFDGSYDMVRRLVIDEDQGQSGRSAEHRVGFQRLLTEVTLEHVGLIMGLEMSRLAVPQRAGTICWSFVHCLARCWRTKTPSSHALGRADQRLRFPFPKNRR